MNSLNFLDAADQNVRGAGQFLLRASPKVAVRASAWAAPLPCSPLAGCRNFLRSSRSTACRPQQSRSQQTLKVPFQGHFANSDDFITPAMVDAFETGLKDAGKPGAFYRYDASHAFMNEQRSVHIWPLRRTRLGADERIPDGEFGAEPLSIRKHDFHVDGGRQPDKLQQETEEAVRSARTASANALHVAWIPAFAGMTKGEADEADGRPAGVLTGSTHPPTVLPA